MDPTALFPKLHAADDPAERIVNEHQALRAELLQLPQHQRAVLICRYLLDLDEAETSAVLGIAPGTAKSAVIVGSADCAVLLVRQPLASGGGQSVE